MTDGKAACLVAPEGARVHETAWSAWEGETETPGRDGAEPGLNPGSHTRPTLRATVTATLIFGSSPVRYRYVERYIMAGDPIFAMGQAEPRRRRGRAQEGEAMAAARFRIRKPDGRQPFVISSQEPSAIHAENQLAATGGMILAVMGVVGGFILWRLRFG